MSLSRRALALLGLAAVVFALAPAAGAAEKAKKVEFTFEYGKERRSWYWEKQVDEEVTTPPGVNPPPGAPALSQRVRLRNPQRPDTLAVAVLDGDHERIAALYIDLITRNVTPNSQIKEFEFFIEESQDRHEQPSFRPEQARIEACKSDTYVPDSDEPEKWENRPKYGSGKTECVEGTREAPQGSAAFWHFDITKIAQEWGRDPFSNQGLVLVGIIEQGSQETWQVNLKVPARDAANTPDNEYESSKNRLQVNLEFVPGDPIITTPPPTDPGEDPTDTTGPTDTGGTETTFTPSTSFTSGDSPSTTTSPTTPTTGGGGGGGIDTGSDSPTAAPPVPVAQTEPAPRLPGYVWALVPLGLIALAMVRAVVVEPTGGMRPDGVIAAIRRRNLERRGGPLRESSGPLLAFVTGARRAAAGLRKTAGGVGKAFSTLTRKGRKR
jgi:hypothetical protein